MLVERPACHTGEPPPPPGKKIHGHNHTTRPGVRHISSANISGCQLSAMTFFAPHISPHTCGGDAQPQALEGVCDPGAESREGDNGCGSLVRVCANHLLPLHHTAVAEASDAEARALGRRKGGYMISLVIFPTQLPWTWVGRKCGRRIK